VKVDWMALVLVFAVSLGTVLGLVVLYSLGLRAVASSRRVAAGTCFAACAAVVGFGIYLIVAA
jgi:hypothetical protein